MTSPIEAEEDFSLDGWDGPIVGAGLSDLANRTQENVTAQKQAEIAAANPVASVFDAIWQGLDTSTTLPVAVAKSVATGLLPGSELSGESMEDLLSSIEDELTAAVTRSDGILVRANTGSFDVSSGDNAMPDDIFDSGVATSDIDVDAEEGTFTVSIPGQYLAIARVEITNDLPDQLRLRVYVNGSPEFYMGGSIMRGVDSSAAALLPSSGYGATFIELEADDVVRLGYNATGASSGGCITGAASGFETFFAISRQGVA